MWYTGLKPGRSRFKSPFSHILHSLCDLESITLSLSNIYHRDVMMDMWRTLQTILRSWDEGGKNTIDSSIVHVKHLSSTELQDTAIEGLYHFSPQSSPVTKILVVFNLTYQFLCLGHWRGFEHSVVWYSHNYTVLVIVHIINNSKWPKNSKRLFLVLGTEIGSHLH